MWDVSILSKRVKRSLERAKIYSEADFYIHILKTGKIRGVGEQSIKELNRILSHPVSVVGGTIVIPELDGKIMLPKRPKSRKGEWLFSYKDYENHCSVCGVIGSSFWNYCPSCGAENLRKKIGKRYV